MTISHLIIIYWALLTVLTAVGGVIGWWELRMDHYFKDYRVSLYLSRILLAESVRSLLTFVGIFRWREAIRPSAIYLFAAAFGATLLTGAIWGWLFYLHGLWNGGGWRELLQRLKGSPVEQDKEKEQDEQTPAPADSTTSPTGDGTNTQSGSDTGGVTDGPGK